MKKLVTLIMVAGVLLLAGCSLFAPHEVRYTITGAGTSTVSGIIYVEGPIVRTDSATTSLPWSFSFDVPNNRAAYLSVSAWNAEPAGTITCSIYVDGDLVDSETDGIMAHAQDYLE